MRNEEPIGTTKRLLKRIRPIEIDRSDRDTVRRLGSIGPRDMAVPEPNKDLP